MEPNDGYTWFIANNPVDRSDPTVQKYINAHLEAGWPSEPWDGLINQGIWRVTHNRGRWGTDISKVVNIPDIPPPPGYGPSPIQGQLRIRGTAPTFIDDRGPVTPLIHHTGDLMARWVISWNRDELHRVHVASDNQLQAIRGYYHGITAWSTLNWKERPGSFWHPLAFGPGNSLLSWEAYRRGCVAFGQRCKELGLVIDIGPGDLKGTTKAEDSRLFALWSEIIGEVGVEVFWQVNALNEARDTSDPGEADPAYLEGLINLIRVSHPTLLCALTAYTGTEDRTILNRFTPSWMSHFEVHTSRAGTPSDIARHVWNMGYDGESSLVRAVGIDAEPAGPGPWVSGLRPGTKEMLESNREIVPTLRAAAWCGGLLPVNFSSAGVVADQPFAGFTGFDSVPRLLQRLPMQAPAWARVHGGKASAPFRVPHDGWRCDFAIDPESGVFMGVMHAQPGEGKARFALNRACEFDLIQPSTGGRLQRIEGPAGTAFEAPPWRVVVGSLL